MNQLNPTIAASLPPRFAITSCSQCGHDTGSGNAGFSACADHLAIDDENEDEGGYCLSCNGSGEGAYDGSTCRTCHGRGE